MPIYRIRRHVIFDPTLQQTREVWGIDRQPGVGGVATVGAPRDTDADDPLRSASASAGGCSCVRLLCKSDTDRSFVDWDGFWEWLSYAEEKGYELISGFTKLSPYSVLVVRGP